MQSQGSIQFVIKFRGGDFDSWTAALEAHEPQRIRHGAVGHWVARSVADPNEFIGVIEFTSRGGAHAYASDADRMAVQQALLLEGGPHHRTWSEGIYEVVDRVDYPG